MDEGLWEMDNDILRFKEERRTRPKPESRGFDQVSYLTKTYCCDLSCNLWFSKIVLLLGF
jgi:hypothetical protein